MSADELFTSLCFSLVLVSVAHAADRTKLSPADLFQAADANKDGKLSYDEFCPKIYASKKHAPGKFKKGDRDKDDALSPKELENVLPEIPWWKMSRKPAEDFFKEADKDSDGSLTQSEFATLTPHSHHVEQHFQRSDADKDGKISLTEAKTYIQGIVEKGE